MTSSDAAAGHLPLTPITYHVLLAVAEAPLHGYGILKSIDRRSGGRLSPSTGSLYLALQRMEEDGLIEESAPPEGEESADARRRYYRLTPTGREVARAETGRLADLVGQAARIGLGATGPGAGGGGR